MDANNTPSESLGYYGWFVVAAAFSICFIGFGSAYTFGVFSIAMQKQFATSPASISLAFSLAGFLYFALGAVSGPLADHWGTRKFAIGGMLLTGAGLILAGLSRTVTQVNIAYGLGVGLGIGCAYVPALGVVQRWFLRRRAFASGVAVSGIGAGTLIMPPVASVLIHAVGWHQAYLLLGCFAGIVGSGMALLIQNKPQNHHLTAGGGKKSLNPAAAQIIPHSLPAHKAVRTRTFAALYAACLICSFSLFTPFVYLVPYAIAHGIHQTAAAVLLSVLGIGSIAGRFILGVIADRVGRHKMLVGILIGLALTLYAWTLASTFWQLVIFAFFYGCVYGGFVALLPSIVADQFGVRSISSIIGILYTSVAFGTLIGPAAMGFILESSHGYTLPIVVGAIGNGIAAVIMLKSVTSRNIES